MGAAAANDAGAGGGCPSLWTLLRSEGASKAPAVTAAALPAKRITIFLL